MKKIYCAGPLFNDKEKEEMQEICDTLEHNNFKAFLPHRDGLEFANIITTLIETGVDVLIANKILEKSIFSLDVFQVIDSDGLILNMNGRVPDEGAMVEAGIAWSSGKPVFIYKKDSRSLLNGNDNPLVLGLSDFNVINEIDAIPNAFIQFFSKNDTDSKFCIDNRNLERIYEIGSQIFKFASCMEQRQLCYNLLKLFGDNHVQAI